MNKIIHLETITDERGQLVVRCRETKQIVAKVVSIETKADHYKERRTTIVFDEVITDE